jgi:hypothetical protein
MFPEVRDVLEKNLSVTHCNVVHQNEVLVDLSHVADVRQHGNVKLTGQQADR